jgi:hypothetical protein
MAWYGIALNGSVGLLLRACDTQKSTITRPLVCSLSPRAMEMTKETKLKKSIYTVAVSLPPWYLPVSSLERKKKRTTSSFQKPSTVVQARRLCAESSTLHAHRGIHPRRLNHARLLGVRGTTARNSAQALPVVPEILSILPHARRPFALLVALLIALPIALIFFPSLSSIL